MKRTPCTAINRTADTTYDPAFMTANHCPCLPHADDYLQMLRENHAGVHEQHCKYPRTFSERHLQCIWYNPDLRPPQLKTISGETVIIEHPGTWNLEAGPDFLGALLLLNGERHLAGDVEIHIEASDWKNHRHYENAQYAGVRIHVTYYNPARVPDLFPPGTIHIALHDALCALPSFDFDMIDLTAYPYNVPGESTPCRNILSQWSLSDVESLLEAAGEARLRIKAQRMESELQHLEPDALLYRETLTALGYKNNKNAFRLLAERIPLEHLRASAGNHCITAYAILAGVSGLLPMDIGKQWDEPARHFLRTVWDLWWKQAEEWHRKILPASVWNLGGVRPANHPIRRLMAVAALFTKGKSDLTCLMNKYIANQESIILKPFMTMLQENSGTWWDHHLTWNGKATPSPIRIIGPERAGAICANVILPLFIARNHQSANWNTVLRELPREADNAIIRQTVFLLLGRDAPRSLLKDPLRRQGLIQLFHDFCLHDRSRCISCTLPDHLHRFHDTSHEFQPVMTPENV